jgi:GNAT superfamily N-acetyltransferase
MNIKQAKNGAEWSKASEVLLRVVQRLNRLNKPLWTEDQVSVAGLQKSYRLEDLYFLEHSGLAGVVFLQEADPLFWPEVVETDSLYVHKLAIDPSRMGAGLGILAIEAVVQEADDRGFRWVRLDCDDRPELHSFYQCCGFEMVDIKSIGIYRVARYQLLTSTGGRHQ